MFHRLGRLVHRLIRQKDNLEPFERHSSTVLITNFPNCSGVCDMWDLFVKHYCTRAMRRDTKLVVSIVLMFDLVIF